MDLIFPWEPTFGLGDFFNVGAFLVDLSVILFIAFFLATMIFVGVFYIVIFICERGDLSKVDIREFKVDIREFIDFLLCR